MNDKTWKQLFIKALCTLFLGGHKTSPSPHNSNAITCDRCGETFWNKAGVIHKHKKLRKNKWRTKFLKKTREKEFYDRIP